MPAHPNNPFHIHARLVGICSGRWVGLDDGTGLGSTYGG